MKRVYFIKPIGMSGPVKVGCSFSPDGRRHSLELWSPFPLEIIAEIDGDFALERRFHEFFLDSHDRREWFHWSARMAQTVDAINAGTFDTATLPDGAKRPTVAREKPWYFGAQMSLSHRVLGAQRRSGFTAPCDPYDVIRKGDEAKRALLESFIVEPHIHGTPCRYRPDEAAAWLAQVTP